jgi:hypothetical protein
MLCLVMIHNFSYIPDYVLFLFCRDPIYRVRDLSINLSGKTFDTIHGGMINHGRDKSGPYRKKRFKKKTESASKAPPVSSSIRL